jgi:3-isopropylmalate/(R)-2-methylmalate dehydratase small subunit
MIPFTTIFGVVAPLARDNIDTDAIMPSRETQSVSRDGYGEKLFANWRYAPGTRVENPDFVLNREPYRNAAVLIGGNNFGCGSSREAAVWGLVQFGIRCVIAPSFGEIFRGNCVRNGLLPAVIRSDDVEHLDGLEVSVDLESQVITSGSGREIRFDIPVFDKDMLLTGSDELEMTLRSGDAIEAFERRDRDRRPWIYSAISAGGLTQVE